MWMVSKLGEQGHRLRSVNCSTSKSIVSFHYLNQSGCDALNATMASMMQAATLGLGSSWYSALLVITTASTFYMSTWETYHTGYLYLGYINGPTEGVILSCISMVFTGLYGKS